VYVCMRVLPPKNVLSVSIDKLFPVYVCVFVCVCVCGCVYVLVSHPKKRVTLPRAVNRVDWPQIVFVPLLNHEEIRLCRLIAIRILKNKLTAKFTPQKKRWS